MSDYNITDNNGVIILNSEMYDLKIDTNKNLYLKNNKIDIEFKKIMELRRDRIHTSQDKADILINIYYAISEDSQNEEENNNI